MRGWRGEGLEEEEGLKGLGRGGVGSIVNCSDYVNMLITESVDSVCRDTTYTQYMLIQKNLSKSQKRYTYKPL